MEKETPGFIQDCRTGWLLVAKDFGSKITDKNKLKYAIQCTGRNPSQSSIDKYWIQNGGAITLTQFCNIMRRETPPTYDILITLFKKFDKNNDGMIDKKDLRKLLTQKGEPMSDSEVDTITNGMNFNLEGKMDYTEFCLCIMQVAEDALRTAQLKVHEREYDLEDERRSKSKELIGNHTKKSSKDNRLSLNDIQGAEGLDDDDMERRRSTGSHQPSVRYPTGSHDNIEGSDAHSSPDDDSDLPTITPSSTQSPLSSVPPTDLPPLQPINGECKKSKDEAEVDQSQSKDGDNNDEVETQQQLPEKDHEDDIPPDTKETKEQLQDTNKKNDTELETEQGKEPIDKEGNNSSSKEEQAEEVDEEIEEESDSNLSTNGRQPDHLPTPTNDNDGSNSTPVLVEGHNVTPIQISTPSKPPKSFETWNSIEGKGCFYSEGDESIKSHQYTLTLPSDTHVWIELTVTPPRSLLVDIGMYVFHMNEDEEPTQMITYTQNVSEDSKWTCRLDLNKGSYILLPYSSGCWLQLEEETDKENNEDIRLMEEKDESLSLTSQCIQVLEEVFNRHDLDGNGVISRNEIEYYHERTSNEPFDDDHWKVLEDNFDHNDEGEMTLKGFLDLHKKIATNENGEQELWNIIESMGYNRQLKLAKAQPFLFEVFTADCDGEMEILPMGYSAGVIEPCLMQLAKDIGRKGTVKDGGDDVLTHCLTTSHMMTIAVENKLPKKCLVQIDCSLSDNCVYSRDSGIYIVEVESNKMEIAFHLLCKDHKKPSNIEFMANLIKS